MKRLAIATAFALLAAPVLANDRADSEAKLAALAEPVIAALGRAMPQPDGMTCAAADQDPSPTNRLLIPNWRAICSWDENGTTRQTTVVLALSESLSAFQHDRIAGLQTAPDAKDARFYAPPDVRAARTADGVLAAPSGLIAALASSPDNILPAKPDALDGLANLLAKMDASTVEGLPEAQAHAAALADYRHLLETQHVALAGLLPPSSDGSDPAKLPAATPDFMFFGAEPLVQTTTAKAGVTMTVTLTTSSFALEAAAEEGRFAGHEKDGDTGTRGQFHDRGRVQFYLGEKGLTALIDGRAMLTVDVLQADDGSNPAAALTDVLAQIATNDFTGY